MAFLGMFSALLILLPNIGATLQLVPAFWLVMMGVLLAGKWPGGDPPAWEAGEARPWPSRAQMQAERAGRTGTPAAAAAGTGDAAPAPTQPSPSASARKRRRKRGGRGRRDFARAPATKRGAVRIRTVGKLLRARSIGRQGPG